MGTAALREVGANSSLLLTADECEARDRTGDDGYGADNRAERHGTRAEGLADIGAEGRRVGIHGAMRVVRVCRMRGCRAGVGAWVRVGHLGPSS